MSFLPLTSLKNKLKNIKLQWMADRKEFIADD